MRLLIPVISLLIIITPKFVCCEELTPREAAMQIAIGGWGDIGEATIVREPNNGGPYSLRIHWKDDPNTESPFWFLGWSIDIDGCDTLSLDVLAESNSGNGYMAVYLGELDGDRWTANLDLSAANVGRWIHYSFKKDQFSFWGLGDNTPNWDGITSIAFEPSGKNAEITVYIDNVVLGGNNISKDLLDPNNIPKPYTKMPTQKYPLNTTNPLGFAFIAGSVGFWTIPGNLDGICKLSPSIGISSAGSAPPEKVAGISRKLAEMKRPLMEEHQDALDFAVELTQAGAWAVRWDGESNNKTPGKFDKGHTACLTHPKFLEMNKRRADYLMACGVNTLTLVDYVWPYWGGRWGYAESDIIAYRKALTGTDGGLKITDKGKTRTISFWDYFEDYSGYKMKPSDVGIASWNEYTPTTEEKAWADNGINRRNMFLFVTLNHYEWLKFIQNLGLYMESKGGHLWIIPNPEDLGDAADYIYAAHLAGLQGNLPEYFGNPIWTEALYRSGGYLKQSAKDGSHLVGPIMETNAGGHGKPYYDAEVSYAAAYDLCASMDADVIKNDFLDGAPFDVMSNPANAEQFDRFRDVLSKVYAFDQFKLDKPVRPKSAIAVVTPRNINRYRGDIFYGFGATGSSYDGCVGEALAREGFIFDMMDTIQYAPIESHTLVFWGVPETPMTSIERMRKWLAQSPSNTLVCSAYQPTRRVSGLGYNPWLSKQDFIEDPLGGKLWGLPKISKDEGFSGGPIDVVKPPFSGAFRIGETINLQDGLYIANGGKVLLSISGHPLVSEFKAPDGGRVIYLHYRAGEPQSVDLDRRITSAIASRYGGKRTAASVDNTIVHNYTIDGGSVNVLWDRNTLSSWEFVYDGNRKQRLEYKNPSVNSTVRVSVSRGGSYIVYDMLNDHTETVQAKNAVELNLNGQICAVYYVMPSNEASHQKIEMLRRSSIHDLLSIPMTKSTDK